MTGDIVLANGVFWGQDRARVEAISISHGCIRAVGALTEARASVANAEVIDLEGAAVLPGFVDNHLHVLNWGRARMGVPCWPGDLSSVAELVARIQSRAAELPPGACIRGRGFDPAQLAEGRPPVASELDVGGDRLVVLESMDFHRRVVNSVVLERAGIGPGTADPPGGHIVRNASGAPTGELVDSARALVDPVIPPWSEAENEEAVLLTARHFLAHGFTRLTNAAPLTMSATGEEVSALGRLGMRGELPIWVKSMVKAEAADSVSELQLPDGLHRGRFILGGLKVFADGAFGPRSAWMSEPYQDLNSTGKLSTDETDFVAMIGRAAATGWQVCVHAIGDRAVSLTARCLGTGSAGTPVGARGHRIEHCCLTDPETIEVMASASLVPVPQLSFITERADDFLAALGEARMHRLYPLRDWIDAGLRPVHGSDAPVSQDIRPLTAVAAGITRRDRSGRRWGVEQAITVTEAVAMLTLWSALADGDPDRGRIEVGYRADLTVLDHDPRDHPPDSWSELDAVMTIVDGVVEWARSGTRATA
jgi:predicted amidohydrolase YtcJ